MLTPNGRVDRLTFFLTVALSAAAEFIVVFALISVRQEFGRDAYYVAVAAVTAPFAWMQICTVIRRLTDIGCHWLWSLPVVPMCLWSLWALVDVETSAVAALVLTVLTLYSAITLLLLSFYRGPVVMLQAPPPPPPPVPAPMAVPEPASIPGPMPGLMVPQGPPPSATYVKCVNGHYYEEQRGSCPYCAATTTGPPAAPAQAPLPMPLPVQVVVPVPAPTVAIQTAYVNPNDLSGWLVVIDGPGRGTEYRLYTRQNRIGRDAGMDVPLADPESPQEYASVTFDPSNSSHLLMPGALPAELNGRAIMQPTRLQVNDRIRVGSTTLIFVPFAGVYHRWDPRWDPAPTQRGVTMQG